MPACAIGNATLDSGAVLARKKSDYVLAAKVVDDLRIPPSNRLETLSRDLAGKWSIRINDQYRITFAWNEG